MRSLFLIHRYLGIAVGLLMVMWCLSGVVMMYVPYPRLIESRRLQHLHPLDWRSCCTFRGSSVPSDLPVDNVPIDHVQLEMLGATPVLHWQNAAHQVQMINTATGAPVRGISEAQASSVAERYAEPGIPPRLIDRIDHDQWTVEGAEGADRPLFHFSLDDSAGTELYVSSVTGKAIQTTTSHERFWNWLGTVPHWIYFSSLRRHPKPWTSVVVGMSTLGSFLAITGLYIGIRQFRRRAYAGFVPYQGVQYWHHLLGLGFGLFILTWVVSGLISMNPWGFLEGKPAFVEAARLQGTARWPVEIEASLAAIATAPEAQAAVSIEAAPLNGHSFLIATDARGVRLRFDAHGQRALLDPTEFDFITSQLAPGGAVLSKELMTAEDEYYFSHPGEHVLLPVYRIILDDAARTRYYVDGVTGQISDLIDRDARWYRWLHEALHRWDFGVAFRASVARSAVMLTLLTGMTVLCGIGVFLGARRVLGSAFPRKLP